MCIARSPTAYTLEPQKFGAGGRVGSVICHDADQWRDGAF